MQTRIDIQNAVMKRPSRIGALVKTHAFLAFGIGMLTAMGSASAGCGDRPGTPDDVSVDQVTANSMRFNWHVTTNRGANPAKQLASGDQTHVSWFDIYIRGPNGDADKSKDLTGTGPYRDLVYWSPASYTFNNLLANVNYCIAIRARTEGGTQGCVSEKTSNWACATTLPPGTKVQQASIPAVGPPRITMMGQPNNAVTISGTSFLPNSPVLVKIADDAVHNVYAKVAANGQPIRSDASGKFNITLQGYCKQPGNLHYSANDGRTVPPSVDLTGTLWSNTFLVRCS